MKIYDHFVLPPEIRIDGGSLGIREKSLLLFFLCVVQNGDGYSFDISLDELSAVVGEKVSVFFERQIYDISRSLDYSTADLFGEKIRLFDYVKYSNMNVHIRFSSALEGKLKEHGSTIKVVRK